MVDILAFCGAIPELEDCRPGVRLRIKEDADPKSGHFRWIYSGGAEEVGDRFGWKRKVRCFEFLMSDSGAGRAAGRAIVSVSACNEFE